MLPDRVGALIIKGKKLLLVTGYDELFYWTPGGTIEDGESHESCLRRELKEELGIALQALTFGVTIDSFNETKGEMQQNHYYLVQYRGKPQPCKEITKIHWYSSKDFIAGKPKVPEGVRKKLIPYLIKKGIL